jgi:hypothetical protein
MKNQNFSEDTLILSWEICPKEYKKNLIWFWWKTIPTFLFFSFVIAFQVMIETSTGFSPLIIFTLIFGLLLPLSIILINKYSKEEDRVYKIFKDGIFVKKGSKEKNYSWKDFDSFYKYSWIYEHDDKVKWRPGREHLQVKKTRENVSNVMKETLGKIYYLEKKRHKKFSLKKEYVVIRTLSDNFERVEEELGKELNKGKWLPRKEIGFVTTEFK